MADVSAWQTTWDPPDQHGAANMYPTSHRAASTDRNSLTPAGVHVRCVLTSDQPFLRGGGGLTQSLMAGRLIKESRRGCLSYNYVYNAFNDIKIFSR